MKPERFSTVASKSTRFAMAAVVLLLLVTTAVAGRVDRAKEFFDEGDYDKAIKLLERHVNRRKNDFQAYLLLGHCFMQKEDYTRAILNYLEANRERPVKVETSRYLGRAYMMRGHFQNALNAYDFVVMNDPRDVDARLAMGFCSLNLQKYNDALGHYRAALQVDQNSTVAMINLARIHNHQGNFGTALEFYEAFLEAAPESNLAAEAEERVAALRKQIRKREVYGLPANREGASDEPPDDAEGAGVLVPATVELYPPGTRGIMLPIQAATLSLQARESLATYSRTALFQRLGIQVLNPENWRDDWLAMDQNGCYTTACIQRIGREVGVGKVILGRVEPLGVQELITFEVYDVESGRIEGMNTAVRDPLQNELLPAINLAIRGLAQAIALHLEELSPNGGG